MHCASFPRASDAEKYFTPLEKFSQFSGTHAYSELQIIFDKLELRLEHSALFSTDHYGDTPEELCRNLSQFQKYKYTIRICFLIRV